MKRVLGAWAATLALLAVPASASAAITSVFAGHTIGGGPFPARRVPMGFAAAMAQTAESAAPTCA